MDSKVKFNNNSQVSFNKNTARRYGGANITSVLIVEENASLDYTNNEAGLAGNSIYFSVSK